MPKKKADVEVKRPPDVSPEPINLGALLSTKPIFQSFHLWLVGDRSPLGAYNPR